jgi:hypothetical protein
MFHGRIKIFAIGICGIFFGIIAIRSYFMPASLRWIHRESFDPSNAAPGTHAAETWEVGAIHGRLRWMHAIWLATPHVPANGLAELPRENGLSVNLRDSFALPLDESDLDWHFAGFGFGHPTFFRQGGAVDSGMDGLWQVNASELCVPIWLLVLMAIFTLIRFGWKQRLNHQGLRCRGCGYDLRATPERCPECGMIVRHC